jgi:FkbM family methyltransferase
MGNYINLLDNINENKLYNCQAFPLALGDKMNLTTLGVKNMIEGVSDSNVGETSEYYHGCVEMSMDWLVEQGTLPQPDHIKIDVDGHEGKVVDGAINTISKCKSVLVELDLEKHMATYEKMLDTGLTLRTKIKRNEHTGSQLYNMIFQKGWTGGVTTDPNNLLHA